MSQANRLNLPSAPRQQQISNRISWNDARSAGTADFFTIGYTGRKTEDIMAFLKHHGVRTLVDVRQNPISMYRPELSKRNLAQLLQDNGMCYVHLPHLANPRDIPAQAIGPRSRDAIWIEYNA